MVARYRCMNSVQRWFGALLMIGLAACAGDADDPEPADTDQGDELWSAADALKHKRIDSCDAGHGFLAEAFVPNEGLKKLSDVWVRFRGTPGSRKNKVAVSITHRDGSKSKMDRSTAPTNSKTTALRA